MHSKEGAALSRDLGIWAYHEKLLQKFHQRVLAHEVSTFLFTVTKANGLQTRVTSPRLSKVFIKGWKWETDEAALPVQSYFRIPASCEISCVTVLPTWVRTAYKSHVFGKSMKQLDWTCPQWLRISGEQRTHCTACRFCSRAGCLDPCKCSQSESTKTSATAPLEMFSEQKGFNQRNAAGIWEPQVHL